MKTGYYWARRTDGKPISNSIAQKETASGNIGIVNITSLDDLPDIQFTVKSDFWWEEDAALFPDYEIVGGIMIHTQG